MTRKQKAGLLCLCEISVALLFFFISHSYRHDGSETLTDDILFAATDGIHFVEFILQVKVSVLHTSESNCFCRRVQSLMSESLRTSFSWKVEDNGLVRHQVYVAN